MLSPWSGATGGRLPYRRPKGPSGLRPDRPRPRAPGAAFDRLATLADMITRDERRLALAMHVASFLAVTASELGQHETAATLFGFAVPERERLDIACDSHQPLVQRALGPAVRCSARCASTSSRLRARTPSGATSRSSTGRPPRTRGSRPQPARPGTIGSKPVAGRRPTGLVESQSCQPEPTRLRPPPGRMT